MPNATVNIPGQFWEYFKRTDIISGADASTDAVELRQACKIIPRTAGKSYYLPVPIVPGTALLLARHVDVVLDGFKDVKRRNMNQLYRAARILQERLNAAAEAMAHQQEHGPAGLPPEGTWDPWTLRGANARRGGAVAVSKAITATTGLRPQPNERRGDGVNSLHVSGTTTGVMVSLATDDPKHWDTESTLSKLILGLESKGYVVESNGVKVDETRGSEYASLWVRGKRKK